jgi:hypothetical protein
MPAEERTKMLVKFMGTTDDVTTCDCCGRSNLKSTVALSIDEADPVYFGVACAAHALKRTAKEVRAESRKADDEKAAAVAAVKAAASRAEFARWTSHLDARAPSLRGNVFKQIESLGGFAAASVGFDRAAA